MISPKTTGTACSPTSTRAEMRVPGADMNVHLALAACFAAGLYGVEKKLELPPPITGDVIKEEKAGRVFESLPKSLSEATEKMCAKGSVAYEVFGKGFVDHFCGTRMEEWNQWRREVTQWEVKRCTFVVCVGILMIDFELV